MLKNKHFILIPPNGRFKKQDFSLLRIMKWLKNFKNIKISLIYIEDVKINKNLQDFINIYKVKDEEEIFKTIKSLDYDFIFHRSWMGAYYFAATLVKTFDNVLINIKDWNFAEKEVYEYLFPDNKDYESIDYIFKNCNNILSHFTKEQSKLWAKKYNTKKNKFKFFPEYCNKDNFNNKPKIKYKKNIKLVYAGKIPPTCYAEEYFPGKAHLRSIKKLTKQKINIDFVLPPKIYDTFYNHSNNLYLDFIYEDKINRNFNILKGKELNSQILDEYHFGFFELETSGKNHNLYKYAVTSKFAFYLEAGIPMLINKKFNSMAKLVKKYNLGIVFNNNDLKNLNKKLKISQEEYNLLCKNIKTFRKKFTYQKNINLNKVFK
ncbi:hypothetical protein CRU98_10690 [Arcobacter sp. CECT 8986]|uniref:hypothetical protein n=1 Tax=Arcobacter sp. CECT 8986 TaxID=2044507 RepID=UPI001009D9DE|nr:hypothetical protein [Arcobacter sp. CECT 8986]RXJ98220.1 hypothetical protein CRU98_10690 [Arcobacter sp. CECT 8986]